MSGGGSKKDKDDDKVTGTTPYANAPTTQTFQPTLPGFEGMIADQLQRGFGIGANNPDFAGMIGSIYQPMTIPVFSEPISTTASMFDKKENAPISTGNAMLDKLLMGQKIPKVKGIDEDSDDERGSHGGGSLRWKSR